MMWLNSYEIVLTFSLKSVRLPEVALPRWPILHVDISLFFLLPLLKIHHAIVDTFILMRLDSVIHLLIFKPYVQSNY